MDTLLAIASRREVREYDGQPLPDDVLGRILDAGRLAGSARNRQPWRFVLVESTEARERLVGLVYMPDNIRGAARIVAIAVRGGSSGFDAGRAAQNMLLAAWNEGVGSCPNGLVDPGQVAELLELAEGEEPAIVLSLGWPARPRDPERRSAAEWSARAERKSLDELVSRV
jgi:nitroreductase